MDLPVGARLMGRALSGNFASAFPIDVSEYNDRRVSVTFQLADSSKA